MPGNGPKLRLLDLKPTGLGSVIIRIFRRRRGSKARTNSKIHSTEDAKEKKIMCMVDRQIPAATDMTTREICTDLKCEVHVKVLIIT